MTQAMMRNLAVGIAQHCIPNTAPKNIGAPRMGRARIWESPSRVGQHAAAKQWAHRDDDWIWSVLEDVDSTHAPSPDDEQ